MAQQNLQPRHVAITMDGNNRWATKRKLPSKEGYRRGTETTKKIILAALDKGIEVVSLFTLSSENVNRPSRQTRELLSILEQALDEGVPEFNEKGVRFSFIGDLDYFPAKLRKKIDHAIELTAKNKIMHVNIAINYGGQWDITQACRKVALLAAESKLNPKKISSKDIAKYITLHGQPEIDLCIRTGNEKRISNFFLWQIAYTELYFAPDLWPDFSVKKFDLALAEYKKRVRRFGLAKKK